MNDHFQASLTKKSCLRRFQIQILEERVALADTVGLVFAGGSLHGTLTGQTFYEANMGSFSESLSLASGSAGEVIVGDIGIGGRQLWMIIQDSVIDGQVVEGAEALIWGAVSAQNYTPYGILREDWSSSANGSVSFRVDGPNVEPGGAVGLECSGSFRDSRKNRDGEPVIRGANQGGIHAPLPLPSDWTPTRGFASVGDVLDFSVDYDYDNRSVQWSANCQVIPGANLDPFFGVLWAGGSEQVQIANPLPHPDSNRIWLWENEPQTVWAEIHWANGPDEQDILGLAHRMEISANDDLTLIVPRSAFNGVEAPNETTHLQLVLDPDDEFREFRELDNRDAVALTPLNISIDRFSHGSLGNQQIDQEKVGVTYRVNGVVPSDGYKLKFFGSEDPHFDSSDIDLGTEITVTPQAISQASHLSLLNEAPSQALVPGTAHTLVIDPSGFGLQTGIEDEANNFILAVADPDNTIDEIKFDNSAVFWGIHHGGFGRPAVVRTIHDREDVVQVNRNGTPLVMQSGTELAVALLASTPSRYLIMTGTESDLVWADPAETTPLRVLAGDGNDAITGASGDDTLLGEEGDDLIIGDGFQLTFDQYAELATNVAGGRIGTSVGLTPVGAGEDHLDGGDGDDILIGGDGKDMLFGGGGNTIHFGDTFSMAAGIEFDAGPLFYSPREFEEPKELFELDGNPVNEAFRLFAMVNLVGDGNDMIMGGDEADFVIGGQGNDTIDTSLGNLAVVFGNEGEDEVDGFSDITVAFGGPDKDELHGGLRYDFLIGGLGNDPITVTGTQFNVAIGDDYTFEGNAPTNWSDYLKAFSEQKIESSVTANPVGNGVDEIVGGTGIDILIGGAGGDIIRAGEEKSGPFGGIIIGDGIKVDVSKSISFTDARDINQNTRSKSLFSVLQDFISVKAELVASGTDVNDIKGSPASDLIIGGHDQDMIDTMGGEIDAVFGGPNTDTIDGTQAQFTFFVGGDGDDILSGPNNVQALGGVLIGDSFDIDKFSPRELKFDVDWGDLRFDVSWGGGLTASGSGEDRITSHGKINLLVGGDKKDTLTTTGKFNVVLGDAVQTSADFSLDFFNVMAEATGEIQVTPLESSFRLPGLVSEGDDMIFANGNVNVVIAGHGNDTVDGGGPADGLDLFLGNDGRDQISGGAGFNAIIGGRDKDILTGGNDGNFVLGDTYDLVGGLPSKLSDVSAGILNFGGLRAIGDGDDEITTGSGPDLIVGGDGSDIIHGGDGRNIVLTDAIELTPLGPINLVSRYFNAIKTTLFGTPTNTGTLNDIIAALLEAVAVGSGDDRYVGGSGKDFAFGGAGNDTLIGNGGEDFLIGSLGDDQLYGGSENGPVELDANIVTGGPGNDNLFGSEGDDHLESEEGVDVFHGRGGNDRIFGGSGNDQLFGEAGNDFLFGEGDDDELDGGPGFDVILGGTGTNSERNGEAFGFDFGDAPHTYGDAASIQTPDGPVLGFDVDFEEAANWPLDGTGDNLDNRRDEDALLHPQNDLRVIVGRTPAIATVVSNTSGSDATLYGWVDYDADGEFSDEERGAATIPHGTFEQVVSLALPIVPANAVLGDTFARFRISTDNSASDAAALAVNGETEDYPAVVAEDSAPIISQVEISSTLWSPAFANLVDPLDRSGYELSQGGNQLRPLPWATLNRIQIQLSKDVLASFDASAVGLYGVNTPDYSAKTESILYDANSNVITILMDSVLEADKYLLVVDDQITDSSGNRLDGEWTDGASAESGNGVAGGDFEFRFDVLPGDTDQSGEVRSNDGFAALRLQFQDIGSTHFLPFADIDGDGNIRSNDGFFSLRRQFIDLPQPEPLRLSRSRDAVAAAIDRIFDDHQLEDNIGRFEMKSIPGNTLDLEDESPFSRSS